MQGHRTDPPLVRVVYRLAEPSLCVWCWDGTNTGIRAIAGNTGHGHSEDDIRYVWRWYLTAEVARAIAVEITDATFAAWA